MKTQLCSPLHYLQEEVYIPPVPRIPPCKPEERKRATSEQATKNQEDWVITIDLKIVIIETRDLSLVQQAHEVSHLLKNVDKNY